MGHLAEKFSEIFWTTSWTGWSISQKRKNDPRLDFAGETSLQKDSTTNYIYTDNRHPIIRTIRGVSIEDLDTRTLLPAPTEIPRSQRLASTL